MVEGSTPSSRPGHRPILVVEDDEDTVATLRVLLADEGYASVAAHDVDRALAALARHAPGLVLLDLSLPDGSGEAVLAAARSTDGGTPVVLMTGRAVIARRAGGVDAVLRKPFEVVDLLRVVALHYRP